MYTSVQGTENTSYPTGGSGAQTGLWIPSLLVPLLVIPRVPKMFSRQPRNVSTYLNHVCTSNKPGGFKQESIA